MKKEVKKTVKQPMKRKKNEKQIGKQNKNSEKKFFIFKFSLFDLKNRFPGNLKSGQKQVISFARFICLITLLGTGHPRRVINKGR